MPAPPHTGKYGYVLQQLWWSSNGKVSRLLDLPPELLDCIYEQVFGVEIYPSARHDYQRSKAFLDFGRNCDPEGRSKYYDTRGRTAVPNSITLLLNKQISFEAHKIGMEGTRKDFSCHFRFQAVAASINVVPFIAMARIGLDFLVIGYIKFFGAHLPFYL